MNNKELKRLSRRELVDIIYQMKRNEELLTAEIAELQAALQEKRMHLSKAGSIADAAASITDVFSTAQSTADLYLHEINRMKEDTETECAQRIDETNAKIANILAAGKKQYEELCNLYQAEYAKWQQLCTEVQALEKTKNRQTNEV